MRPLKTETTLVSVLFHVKNDNMKRLMTFLVLISCMIFLPWGLNAVEAKMHRINLIIACGFNRKVKLNYSCSSAPPPSISDIISKMIAFNGNKSEGIRIEDSPGLDYPVVGRDSFYNVIIIVDAKRILSSPNWYMYAMLSHELAHITNRDVYEEQCVNKKNELAADYYTGFWTRRAGCEYLDSVIAPCQTVPLDEYHPPHIDRANSVRRGWKDGDIPFTIKPPKTFSGIAAFKDTYGRYLSIFATITPYKWHLGTKTRYMYKRKVLLSTNDKRVLLKQILPVISSVRYSFDDDHFRIPLAVISNAENDYCYMALDAWKKFPITCTVYFVDNSYIKMSRNFDFE
jgi:hypothetical protein